MSRAAAALGGFVVFVGLLVLTGWVLRIEGLLRLHPALPAMQFNPALLFVTAGLALDGRRPAAPAPGGARRTGRARG